LGIDHGERRIGIAISDASKTLARPLTTLERKGSDAQALDGVLALVREAEAEDGSLDLIVVGLPRHLDGTPSERTGRVAAFAQALQARTAIAVVTEDERLSSREAESRLASRHKHWRDRKARLDAAAAAVILQDYLDRMAGPGGVGGA
jgi:putative Holliday junction resolvase